MNDVIQRVNVAHQISSATHHRDWVFSGVPRCPKADTKAAGLLLRADFPVKQHPNGTEIEAHLR